MERGVGEAVSQICSVSLGLPNYVHALGLAAGRAAIDRRSRRIDTEDVAEAIKGLVLESQQTVIRAFDLATASPRRQNFFSPGSLRGCFQRCYPNASNLSC